MYLKTCIALLATLFCLNISAGINSEDKPIEAVDTSRVVDLDEVTVLSQSKDIYKLRQQPVSASMLSGEQMQQLGVGDLRDLSAYTPAFVMPNYGSRLTSSVYVRGIGSRVNNPAIGIYVDGMPLMSKSAFNYYFYGIDHADIVRGPQGTLFGQNSEGGLVRIYTHNPMNYQGTDLKLSFGNHFRRNAEITHYNKVSDKFAFSLGGFYNGTNGFLRNQATGERADKMNEAGGRIRLAYKPTQRLTVDYIADYQYVRQNAFPYGIYNEETKHTTAPNTNYQNNYRRNVFNTALNIGFKANGFDFFSNTSYQYLKDYMLMDQDYMPSDFMHLEQRQFQNAFTQEFVLKSNNRSRWHWTTGAYLAASWLKTWAPIYFGDAITGRIAKGIETAMYNAMVNSMAGRFLGMGMTMEQAQEMARQTIERAGGVSMKADMDVPGVFRTPQLNMAVFHESNIEITDNLTATLGLRYDYNRTALNYNTSAVMAMTANVMGQQATNYLTSIISDSIHNNFEQLLPKVALKYRFGNTDNVIYATWSKGYRAGGYNIQMFSDILQTELNANSQAANRSSYDIPHTAADYENITKTIEYKPETSWNYEFGTHLNLIDNALQLDFAGYYMQIKNQQISVMAGNYGYGRQMTNAGKSYSCGVELALRGALLDNHLTWNVNYGYTHAVFKEYKDVIAINGTQTEVDYKNKKVPYVPAHTFAAMADYRFDLTNSFINSIIVGANVTGNGKTYWDEANTVSQNLYAVLGAHLDINIDKCIISFWGRNLTNNKYNTFMVNSGATGQVFNFAQRANPIEYGVDLRIHL